jgi:hypothetical protein
MKKNKNFILAILVIVASISFSSCASKKKYGCPSHISMSSLISSIIK